MRRLVARFLVLRFLVARFLVERFLAALGPALFFVARFFVDRLADLRAVFFLAVFFLVEARFLGDRFAPLAVVRFFVDRLADLRAAFLVDRRAVDFFFAMKMAPQKGYPAVGRASCTPRVPDAGGIDWPRESARPWHRRHEQLSNVIGKHCRPWPHYLLRQRQQVDQLRALDQFYPACVKATFSTKLP